MQHQLTFANANLFEMLKPVLLQDSKALKEDLYLCKSQNSNKYLQDRILREQNNHYKNCKELSCIFQCKEGSQDYTHKPRYQGLPPCKQGLHLGLLSRTKKSQQLLYGLNNQYL